MCCIYVPPTSSLLSCSVSVSTKRFHAPQGSHKPTDPVGSFPAAQHLEPSLPHNPLSTFQETKGRLKSRIQKKHQSKVGLLLLCLLTSVSMHLFSLLCSPPLHPHHRKAWECLAVFVIQWIHSSKWNRVVKEPFANPMLCLPVSQWRIFWGLRQNWITTDSQKPQIQTRNSYTLYSDSQGQGNKMM